MKDTISYFYKFHANAKERWYNKTILEVMESDFFSQKKDYYIKALQIGALRVNDTVVKEDYIIKNNDLITHLVHIHEPILPKIQVISEEEEFIIVNKPSGVPCHPTSRFRTFTVLNGINEELICAHRLDIPTSGVLILYKKKYKENLKKKLKSTKKIYVAKVEGKFHDEITVDKRIKVFPGKGSVISEDGKECTTVFRLLEYKDGYSLVECELKTGRTHQIRVHLLYLGYPIVNDIKYRENNNENVYLSCDENKENFDDELKVFAVENCIGLNERIFNYESNFICLHAYKYFFDNKWY